MKHRDRPFEEQRAELGENVVEEVRPLQKDVSDHKFCC